MEPITDHMRNVSLNHRAAEAAMAAANTDDAGTPNTTSTAAGAGDGGSSMGGGTGGIPSGKVCDTNEALYMLPSSFVKLDTSISYSTGIRTEGEIPPKGMTLLDTFVTEWISPLCPHPPRDETLKTRAMGASRID